MEKSDDRFCITIRRNLDVIEVYNGKGEKILEVAILETRKFDVKLGFRAKPEYKYTLVRALDDGIH